MLTSRTLTLMASTACSGYQQLDASEQQIRILRLSRASKTTPDIRGDLEIISLKQPPQDRTRYSALSYY